MIDSIATKFIYHVQKVLQYVLRDGITMATVRKVQTKMHSQWCSSFLPLVTLSSGEASMDYGASFLAYQRPIPYTQKHCNTRNHNNGRMKIGQVAIYHNKVEKSAVEKGIKLEDDNQPVNFRAGPHT